MPAFLRERYLAVDPRVLGLFRIYFGVFLAIDVLRRLPDAGLFYSNDGVLSNHFNLFAPQATPAFSLLNAFSTKTEVQVAFVLMALGHLGLALGWRTKLFQVTTLLSVVSMNGRNLFLENGGCVMSAVLAAWTLFLPLGERYSIDSLLLRLRRRPDPTAASLDDRTGAEPATAPLFRLAMLGITVEIAACYFFNTVHKNGETWARGEAVHWVLWQNRIATAPAAWLRMHEPSWLSPLLSYGTLVVEGAAPLFVLSPFFQTRLRTLHVLLVWGLHLGIALLVSVGPFSYAMLGLNLLLLPGATLDRVVAFVEARTPGPVEVAYQERSSALHALARVLSRLDGFVRLRFVDVGDAAEVPRGATFAARAEGGAWRTGSDGVALAARSLPLGRLYAPLARLLPEAFFEARAERDPAQVPAPLAPLDLRAMFVPLGEVGAAVLLVAVLVQLSHDNGWIPPKYRLQQPRALAPVVLYPRLIQGWSMFAPDAPRQDGTLVVDAVTADGRHVDPFTGAPPDFDAPFHGPWYIGQLRCDYWLKIHWDGNAPYREELRKYLERWHEIEKRPPSDKLVTFTVYWVENDAPPPGSTTPTNVRKTAILVHPKGGAVSSR